MMAATHIARDRCRSARSHASCADPSPIGTFVFSETTCQAPRSNA